MNKQQFLDLFKDGAYWEGGKFYHSSFRKGFRSIKSSNISFMAAKDELRRQGLFQYESGKAYVSFGGC